MSASPAEKKSQPPLLYPPYRSTVLRAPQRPLIRLPAAYSDLTQPVYGHLPIRETDNDLTRQSPGGEPQGERIIVAGRILDEDGRPLRRALVEVWQANAAGRYRHAVDQHPAPLDPHFLGAGRCETDDDGGYRFTTIKPGAYPWRNHDNAWRPAHIHYSLFGTAFTQRMITQMYFPGDPLFPLDPIYQSIADQGARDRLIASYDHDLTEPEWALGYTWDIVLTGPKSTWMEPEDADE